MTASTINEVIERLRSTWETLESDPLLNALQTVSEREAAALRREILRVLAFLEDSVSNPCLGSLFDRTGKDPLNAMQAAIANAYGVKMSFASTTGTTGLNVPAVMALAKEGQRLAVGRDCHVSVIAGICLSGAVPTYLIPPFDGEHGVLLPPTPSEVGALLDTSPDVRAIVLTMPTYHGLMGDTEGIVDACHRRGVVVMVDGAHGPHFHFLGALGFPPGAEDVGADLVTQSTHKVLSALNQASLLHFNNLALIPRYAEFQSMGFQSTSFSYPLLMSIEHAIEQMVTDGTRTWGIAVERASRLRDAAAQLPGVRVVDRTIVDGTRILGWDPTRVTLNVRNTGFSGYALGKGLHERGILIEMATPDVLLFLVSPSVTDAVIDDTIRSLGELLLEAPEAIGAGSVFEPPSLPEQVVTPRQAVNSMRERVRTRDAIGRISAETIGCYPPGQAIVVAGERLSRASVEYLTRAVNAGGHLKRVEDDRFATIQVLQGTR